eukprot:345642-Amphidinium_carterae.1
MRRREPATNATAVNSRICITWCVPFLIVLPSLLGVLERAGAVHTMLRQIATVLLWLFVLDSALWHALTASSEVAARADLAGEWAVSGLELHDSVCFRVTGRTERRHKRACTISQWACDRCTGQNRWRLVVGNHPSREFRWCCRGPVSGHSICSCQVITAKHT